MYLQLFTIFDRTLYLIFNHNNQGMKQWNALTQEATGVAGPFLYAAEILIAMKENL